MPVLYPHLLKAELVREKTLLGLPQTGVLDLYGKTYFFTEAYTLECNETMVFPRGHLFVLRQVFMRSADSLGSEGVPDLGGRREL
jgi:hypothetical protein